MKTGTADEVCEWCVKKGYQMLNFYEGSISGDIVNKETNKYVGYWLFVEEKYEVYVK